MSQLDKIYTHIEQNKGAHVARMQEYLRQPSVSATGQGITACAQLLAGYYEELGCQQVAIERTAGHPAVWGFYDAGAPKTVAVYGMYDVQPIAQPEGWHSDPFGAELMAGESFPQVCVARGAYNSKGTYRLFLNALEAIKTVQGELPVNLMFLTDGEEEIGSPHYGQMVAKYTPQLQQADFLLDIEANQTKEGQIIMKLGNKGIIYAELVASGERWGRGPKGAGIHSSYKAIVDSPTMRLVQALATLTTPDGNEILIEGLYDAVRPVDEVDEALMQRLADSFDRETYGKLWGVSSWVDDVDGVDWVRRYLFEPSLNINGLIAGNKAEGVLTVLDHEARAHLDIRLVPDMMPDVVIEQLKAHLIKHGFGDIEVRVKAAYAYNKTSVGETAVRAAQQTYQKYNIPCEVWPLSAGSEPLYLFTQDPLNLPMIRYGLGHGSRNHAPNEYLVVEGKGKVAGVVEIEKAYVDFLYQVAQ